MLEVRCKAVPRDQVPAWAKSVLVPIEPRENFYFDKIRLGVALLAVVKNYRNMRQHNKFFALLGRAFEAQDAIKARFKTSERFRAYLICRGGQADIYDAPSQTWDGRMFAWICDRTNHVFFEELEDGSGVRVYMPKSMAVEKMDGPTFKELYERVMDVLTVEFGLDVTELGREPT